MTSPTPTPLTFRLWLAVSHWPGDDAIAEQLKALEQDGRDHNRTSDQRAAAWLEFGLVCEQQMGQRTFALEAYCEAMMCRPELFADIDQATRERMAHTLDPLGRRPKISEMAAKARRDHMSRHRYCTICGIPIPRLRLHEGERVDRRVVKTCNARQCRMFARGRGTFGQQAVIKEPDPIDDRQLLTNESAKTPRSCNRHVDCDAADARARERQRPKLGRPLPRRLLRGLLW